MVVQVEEAVQATVAPDGVLGEEPLAGLRARVTRLAGRHPLYPGLTEAGR